MTLRSILGAATALGLVAGAPAVAQDDPTTVGYIYVGSPGDGGWTFTHDQARLAVEAEYGDDVETIFTESVAEGPDAERVMTQMALSGADIIFATSFGYGPEVNSVAAQFPDIAFEHATGYLQEQPNVGLYNARFYEGRAVIGHMAGRMTETDKIGYIASYPIPEVIMGINSAYLHAKKVNPDVEFSIVWLYTWEDAAQEAAAAEALIEQGVDILMQHTDTTAPLLVAQDRGALGFGQAADMSGAAPEAHLTGILDLWAPYYIQQVGAVMDGTWEAGNVWHGFAEGMVGMAPFGDMVPDDVKAEAEALIASIADGSYHPFTGPINRQDGTPWLAEGETALDGDLLSMDFYVEGITSEIPN